MNIYLPNIWFRDTALIVRPFPKIGLKTAKKLDLP